MRVLILEDESSMAVLLEQIAKHLWPDAEVCLAATAESALEQWRAAEADLALLDWELPGASGIEVLKTIKQSASKTRCVMVTAHNDRHSILAAVAQHVDAFIVKPFEIEEVKTRLLQVVAASSQVSHRGSASGAEDCESIDEFVSLQIARGTLGLPISPPLVDSIKEIRQLDVEEMRRLLNRCQHDPAMVLRVVSLANSDAYLRGAEPFETFGAALRRIGLSGLVNLASEMAQPPGSTLSKDWMRAKYQDFQSEGLALANILTRLNADVEFDADALRTACLLCRAGEVSLLAVMQAWMERGHSLDESWGETILAREGARAGFKIKRQWNLPQSIRTRVGAAYQLPVGTVRKEEIIMRIAALVHSGDPRKELPRLLARLGLPADAVERYRVPPTSPNG